MIAFTMNLQRGEDMKTYIGRTQSEYGIVIQGVFGVFTEAF